MPDTTPHAFLGRFIVFSAILAAVLAGLEGLAATAFRSPTELLKYRTLFQAERIPQGMVLGSSTLAYSLNPRQLDGVGSFYNFAYSGAGVPFLRDWYRLYRQRHEAPAVVVLGADWSMMGPFFRRTLAQDGAFMPPDVAVGVLVSQPGADLLGSLSNAFSLLRDKHRIESWLAGVTPVYELDMSQFDRGFAPLKARPFHPIPAGTSPYVPAMEAGYRELVQTLRRDGAQVIMVQPPFITAMSESHDDVYVRMRAIAHDHGAHYLNYADEHRSSLNEDRSAFADWQHLNEQGAERFGAMVARDVAALPRPSKPHR